MINRIPLVRYALIGLAGLAVGILLSHFSTGDLHDGLVVFGFSSLGFTALLGAGFWAYTVFTGPLEEVIAPPVPYPSTEIIPPTSIPPMLDKRIGYRHGDGRMFNLSLRLMPTSHCGARVAYVLDDGSVTAIEVWLQEEGHSRSSLMLTADTAAQMIDLQADQQAGKAILKTPSHHMEVIVLNAVYSQDDGVILSMDLGLQVFLRRAERGA